MISTNSNSSHYLNLGLKTVLASGLVIFGGVQLISGYGVLGLTSLLLGGIFAQVTKDSIDLFNKPNNNANSSEFLTKPPSISAETKTIKPSAPKTDDNPRKKDLVSVNIRTPTLNLKPENLVEVPETVVFSRRKRSPNRFSQKPSKKALASAREMTVDELTKLISQESPSKKSFGKFNK